MFQKYMRIMNGSGGKHDEMFCIVCSKLIQTIFTQNSAKVERNKRDDSALTRRNGHH